MKRQTGLIILAVLGLAGCQAEQITKPEPAVEAVRQEPVRGEAITESEYTSLGTQWLEAKGRESLKERRWFRALPSQQQDELVAELNVFRVVAYDVVRRKAEGSDSWEFVYPEAPPHLSLSGPIGGGKWIEGVELAGGLGAVTCRSMDRSDTKSVHFSISIEFARPMSMALKPGDPPMLAFVQAKEVSWRMQLQFSAEYRRPRCQTIRATARAAE